jgi:hypothetical protein
VSGGEAGEGRAARLRAAPRHRDCLG